MGQSAWPLLAQSHGVQGIISEKLSAIADAKYDLGRGLHCAFPRKYWITAWVKWIDMEGRPFPPSRQGIQGCQLWETLCNYTYKI